ncbi:MAG: aryl-sulfate sulfotransferase [Candidatus Poseidoniia archaeon]
MSSESTYLIDAHGRMVHSWTSPSGLPPGMAVYMLEDGDLLRTTNLGTNFDHDGNGVAGKIERLSWDSEMEWEWFYPGETNRSHHDIEPLSNGNFLMIAWDFKNETESHQAGRNPNNMSQDTLWPDKIVEVQPVGTDQANIVWEWNIWDHLIQDYDSTKDNYGVVGNHPELLDINFVDSPDVLNPYKSDWMHCNGIDFNPILDQIALSCRNVNEIYIIDHSTTTEEAAGHAGGNSGKGGDILYRWGNPEAYRAGTNDDQQLFGQHDIQWINEGRLGAGDLIVFNNGVGRDTSYSSADVISPPLVNGEYVLQSGSSWAPAAPSWSWDQGTSMYATSLGGVERLENGNTLVTWGVRGTFIEVNPEGEVVWKYINPVIGTGPMNQGDDIPENPNGKSNKNKVFKTHRYNSSFPGFIGKDLTPGDYVESWTDDCSNEESIPWDSDGDGCIDDSDGDGVKDNEDLCSGYDDNVDIDGDTIPDDCDSLIDLFDDWDINDFLREEEYYAFICRYQSTGYCHEPGITLPHQHNDFAVAVVVGYMRFEQDIVEKIDQEFGDGDGSMNDSELGEFEDGLLMSMGHENSGECLEGERLENAPSSSLNGLEPWCVVLTIDVWGSPPVIWSAWEMLYNTTPDAAGHLTLRLSGEFFGDGEDEEENGVVYCGMIWPEDSFKAAVYSFVAEYELDYGFAVGCYEREYDNSLSEVALELEENWDYSGDALAYAQDWVNSNAADYDGNQPFDLASEFNTYGGGLGWSDGPLSLCAADGYGAESGWKAGSWSHNGTTFDLNRHWRYPHYYCLDIEALPPTWQHEIVFGLDDDGDGYINSSDAFPSDPLEWVDTDGDGIGDNADTDDDDDGWSDDDDEFPLDASEWVDTDGDGIGDNADDDDDDDGWSDDDDEFPLDASEWVDTDGDGIGDNADDDDDDDGWSDDDDEFPLDASEWVDTDGDGIGDNADAFPEDPSEWTDSDNDGTGDNADAFPEDPSEWTDSDNDGTGDNADAFPEDPSEWTDSDNDGTGDNADEFPLDASEWGDIDGDGFGDNADAFPEDPSEWTDSDGNGVGDNSDAFPDDPDKTEKGLPGFGSVLVMVSMAAAAMAFTSRREPK